MNISGFRFSKILIVESLESHEMKTGRNIYEFTQGLLSDADFEVNIEYKICSNSVEFIEIIKRLTDDTQKNGEYPILHVECHGDLEDGLEFENGSTLPWTDISLALLPLNIATKFNLLCLFSACYGGHFLSQMGVVKPAPCWCLIAPTEKADPAELFSGFRIFYSTLFLEIDAGKAAAKLAREKLINGNWLSEPAELWYERVITNYLISHCTIEATRERAKKLYRQQIKQGNQQLSIGGIVRQLKHLNQENIKGKYFDEYFLIADIPANKQRFKNTRDRIQKKLKDLINTRKYCL